MRRVDPNYKRDWSILTFIINMSYLCFAYIPALILDFLVTPFILITRGEFVFGFINGVYIYQRDYLKETLYAASLT